jgi:hypothetical protein
VHRAAVRKASHLSAKHLLNPPSTNIRLSSLARAELYLTLAAIFYRFDMELYETTRKDVDPKHDYFVATPAHGSKGVRVLVK